LTQVRSAWWKQFFFEKKNQKTSTSLGSLYPEGPKPKRTKVFCFFYSKKTSFLPFPGWFVVTFALPLAACQSPVVTVTTATPAIPTGQVAERPPPDPGAISLANQERQKNPRGYTVLHAAPAWHPAGPGLFTPAPTGGTVRLQFAGADIRDVARAILGDMLHLNYVVDPQVQGQLTIAADQPIERSAVLKVFESALGDSGFALVKEGDQLWHVTQLQTATRNAFFAPPGSAGFGSRTIALRWVAASDIARTLNPILPNGASLRADESRNLITVAGPSTELDGIADNIAALDLDTLQGQSFAMVPLVHAQAKTIAAELPKLLGPAAAMVRLFTLDQINAVFIASVQPDYVLRAESWIARLDQGTGGTQRRIYVYRVQYGRTGDISSVLAKLLGIQLASGPGGGSSAAAALPGAGGLPGAMPPEPATQTSTVPAGPSSQNPLLGTSLNGADSPLAGAAPPGGSQFGEGIRITQDETNNALLVMATPQEWETIQAALAKLDTQPLQVLIEASIAEVTLTGQLQYGLQYFLKSGNFSISNIANNSGQLASSYPGLNLVFAGGSGANVILDALEQLTKVHMLASPDLLVLNNQKARLQVGDQVPVATASAVSTLTSGAPVVNTIEYRDTGVILEITPRVNANGLVMLDLAQEVSGVSSTTTSSLNSPTIQQRRISSSVAVEDGQTIALGGLIQDNRTESRTGIPVLQNLPYVGALFGVRTKSLTRTELVVLMTPHVVHNRKSAEDITAELRSKLPLLAPPVYVVRPAPVP
jgi:general secretion pathway protein D